MIKKSLILAGALALGQLTVTPTQAAGLGDLFNGSESSEKQFLPVNQAFQVMPVPQNDTIRIEFNITPGYYVYQDKVKLSLPDGVKASKLSFNQKPEFVDDPEFGRVAVFEQSNVIATAQLTNTQIKALDNAPVTITWQGCAKAGLCYPPQKIHTQISLPAAKATEKTADKKNDQAEQNAKSQSSQEQVKQQTQTDKNHSATQASSGQVAPTSASVLAEGEPSQTSMDKANVTMVPMPNTMSDATMAEDMTAMPSPSSEMMANSQEAPSQAVGSPEETEAVTSGLVDADPFGLAKHPILALFLLFLAGLGLAFTPCVLPMLPIVANIVAHQHKPSVKKGMLLTAGYGVGVATAYGILGALIAIFGQSLGIIGWLQNPAVLLSFAVIFILLALYMMEALPIRLPSTISQKLHKVSQVGDNKLGSVTGSFVAGLLSALVVSPCVSAPLFGALLAVSTIGNPLLGFAALFMLGLGLSAPLLLINLMPKAGEWMNWVKHSFALLLFAVALLLIERVFISPLMLIIWAVWFMVLAIWLWRWSGGGHILTKAIGILSGTWAVFLVMGASLGSDDSWQPLAKLTMVSAPAAQIADSLNTAPNQLGINAHTDKKITTLAQLDEIIASEPKVLVDVTADWCIECRIMEKTLFTNRPKELMGWQVVKLDISDTTPESTAILEKFNLFGPPSLLYYKNGKVVAQQVGEVKRAEFEKQLSQLNQ